MIYFHFFESKTDDFGWIYFAVSEQCRRTFHECENRKLTLKYLWVPNSYGVEQSWSQNGVAVGKINRVRSCLFELWCVGISQGVIHECEDAAAELDWDHES